MGISISLTPGMVINWAHKQTDMRMLVTDKSIIEFGIAQMPLNRVQVLIEVENTVYREHNYHHQIWLYATCAQSERS